MMATYTTRLRLTKQALGENAGGWHTGLNEGALDMIDEAISGMVTVNTTGGNTNLSANNGATDQSRPAILKITGTLASNATITIPAVSKKYIVWNATTGAFTLTVKTSGGTGVVVEQGQKATLFCDGTDTFDAISTVTTQLSVDSLKLRTAGTSILTALGIALAITTGAAATATSPGNTITITAGTAGATSGAGGTLILRGGAVGASGEGGWVQLEAADGAGSSNGGGVGLYAGEGLNGGGVELLGGSARAGDGGNGGGFTIESGYGADGATGGNITMRVRSGLAATSVSGGTLQLIADDAIGTNKNGGIITISAGAATGSGNHGYVALRVGNIDQVRVTHTPSANRYITMTGSNGGNPTIGVTAGSLAVSGSLIVNTINSNTGAVLALQPGAAANATAAGNDLTITAGSGGGTSGDGGGLTLQGGVPTSGAGGAVSITGRNGAGTNSNGGAVVITAGNGNAAGVAGTVTITGGTKGVGGSGGTILISGGSGSGTGVAGCSVTIQGGQASDGNGGSVTVQARGANGTNRVGGDLTLSAGGSTGTGAGGTVFINAGSVVSGTAGVIQLRTNFNVEQVRITHTASAVNRLQLTGGATTADVVISADGETNVGITVTPKGTGTFKVPTAAVDTNTTQAASTAFVMTAVRRKNVVINGDFAVWQRGTSFGSVATNAYVADRWQYQKTGAMVHDITRDTAVVPTVAEAGKLFHASIKIDCQTVDSSIAAGDHALLLQFVEGYNFRHLAQRTFTVSFWVRATKTGIYCVAFQNAGAPPDRSYVAEYTVNATDTWEKKTVVVSASPSAGAWDYTTGKGLVVVFVLAAGSTYHTTANAWQTGNFFATANQVNACDSISNNFWITGVQIEAGGVATDFEQRTIQDELHLCQRYYEKSYPVDTVAGTASVGGYVSAGTTNMNSSTHAMRLSAPFRVLKRAGPTCTIYDLSGNSGRVNFPDTTNNVVASVIASSETAVDVEATSGTVTDTRMYFHWVANAEL